MSVFATSLEEAARLNDADPLVQAGRVAYDRKPAGPAPAVK